MSDIVERLRNWRTVHLALLHLVMEEAADEIERLSRTGVNDAKTGEDAADRRDQGVKLPERERLTDAEREAIAEAAGAYNDNDDDEECAKIAATLHGILKRLG